MENLVNLIAKITPILENLNGVMIFVKDLDGRYVYITKSFLDVFEKQISDLLYKKAEEVWGKTSKQINLLIEDEKSILSGEFTISDRNICIVNSNLQEKYIRVFKTPLYDIEEKKIIGIITIGIDITSDQSMLFSLLHMFFRRLSKSEKQYFFFRSQGQTRAKISKDMDTTIETIDSYRYRIMKKLKVNDQEMMFLEKIYKLFIDESFNMQQKF